MLCLLLAGNNIYSKNATFFGSNKFKTDWSKKGFSSSIAKPDARFANISIVVNKNNAANINQMMATCTNTGTLNTTTQTTTPQNTTLFTYIGNGSVLTNTNTASTTATLVLKTTTQFTFTLPSNTTVFTNTNTASVTNTLTPDITTAFTYLSAGAVLTNTNTASTTLTLSPTTILTTISNFPQVVADPVITNASFPAFGAIDVSYTKPAGSTVVNFFRDGVAFSPYFNDGTQLFKDRDQAAGSTHTYAIEIKVPGLTCPSIFSNSKSFTFTSLPAPSNLTAFSVSCSQIDLSWTDNSNGPYSEAFFEVFRSENGGPLALIASPVAANTIKYVDNSIKANTLYSYAIRGVFNISPTYSAFTSQAAATTKPIVLNLTSNSATAAKINWALCSANIQGWKIYSSVNNAPFVEVAQVGPQVNNYDFKALIPDKNYRVYIAGITNAGLGLSNTLSFATPKFPGPTNLKADPQGQNGFKVTWKDNSNGPDFEEAFWLYKSLDNGLTYTKIVVQPTITEYVDAGLTASQKVCYYVVAAFSSGVSDPSNTDCNATCPNPITEITKAYAASSTQINLEWNLPVNAGTTKIIVESSTDGITFTKLGEVAGTVTGYVDTSVLPNQKKYYRVYVSNGGTCAIVYSAVNATASCPLAPTGVKAMAINSNDIEVNWDLVAGIKTYVIERSTDNIDFVLAGEVDGALSKFTDTKLASSKKYYYRVKAKNEGTCTSEPSQVKQESTATTCAAPPSNVVVVANSSKEIKVTFTDNSPDETGFEVELSKDEKTWTKAGGTLAANTTSVTISTGIDAETKYFVRVRALGELCNSVYSNIANVTTNPQAPTTLAAKGVKINQIDLTWVNVSKTATGIEIQRASGADNNFVKIGNDQVATLTAYSDNGLTPATNYKYRIRAKGPNGLSDWSNVADATTLVIAANEDETLGKNVSLFPVPTQNTLFIKSAINILGKVNAKIFNSTGSELLSHEFNGLFEGKTEQMNVSTLGTGIYFLEVATQKGRFTKKFMKQ